MGNVIRVCFIIAALVAATASATAPARHAIHKADTIAASYEATWSALIELFAERSWTISNLGKDSGLITTDWMAIDNDTPYADCGGSGISTVLGTQIRFNVFVKDLEGRASVAVNTSFRQLRSFDKVQSQIECTSKGGVEQLIHREVAERAARSSRTPNSRATPAAVSHFYCTAAPADPTRAACARSSAGCAKRQADLVAAVGDATPCSDRASAVCFNATTAEGTVTESCHPTAEACTKQHGTLADDQAAFTAVTTCERTD